MSDNLDRMRARLDYLGGEEDKNRLINGKQYTLEDALKRAHNSHLITIDGKELRVLINANKLKQYYDERIIAAPWGAELKTGDVIYWTENQTYWLIYLQDLGEEAYFRAYMRKCKAELITETSKGTVSVRAAIVGPELKKIAGEEKVNDIYVEYPNLTIQVMVPKNDQNKEIFKRYSKFKYDDITWKIQSVNSVDLDNIIIFQAMEDYEIIDEPQPDVPTTSEIKGNFIIKPLQIVDYTVDGGTEDLWSVDNNKIDVISHSATSIRLKWNDIKSGEFILSYGTQSQKIVVESLF